MQHPNHVANNTSRLILDRRKRFFNVYYFKN